MGRGDARYRKTAPFRAQFIYFGGVVESAGGGGVAVPLLSGGGVVDGLVWSAGGVVVVESAGAAGAVVDESAGPGEVDCCLEQATRAKALMHKRIKLRFMGHLTVYREGRRGSFTVPGGTQRTVASGVPLQPRPFMGPSIRGPGARATPRSGGYFLAAARFFFLAGSFGRLLPKEP